MPSMVYSYSGIRFSFVSLIFRLFFANGRLLSRPEDTIAVIGGTVHLLCRTDLTEPVRWSHTRTGTRDVCPVYWGNGVLVESYKDRFSVVSSEGYMNLTIRNVQPKDAGLFTCSDLRGYGIDTEEHGSANLIVLDGEMRCTSLPANTGLIDCDQTSDNITLTCDVKYSGNVSPSLEWRTTNCKNVTLENPVKSLNSLLKTNFANSSSSSIAVSPNDMRKCSMFTCAVTQSSMQVEDSSILPSGMAPKFGCINKKPEVSVTATQNLKQSEEFSLSINQVSRTVTSSAIDKQDVLKLSAILTLCIMNSVGLFCIIIFLIIISMLAYRRITVWSKFCVLKENGLLPQTIVPIKNDYNY